MTPGEILTHPLRIDVRALPQIYKALQSAWVTDDGGFPVPADTLTEASDTACTPVAGVTTRSVYSLLMEGHLWEPSCIQYFAREYGPLYWPCTRAQMHWFRLNRPVIDLSCQIARVVLRTGYRLVISFGMAHIPIVCFCSSSAIETLDHLFFSYPLAQSVLSWLDRCSVLIPSLAHRHVLFGFNHVKLFVMWLLVLLLCLRR